MAQAMHLLTPRGRFLNHAITRPTGRRGGMKPDGFINRYVFPDGELLELGQIIGAMHRVGLDSFSLGQFRHHDRWSYC